MRMTQMHAALVTALVSALWAGCMSEPTYSRTPNLDEKFGVAVETARAQQTLNPNAAKNTDPVKGIDGRAGREAVERYEASFQRPQPPSNIFSIGVSGNNSGAQ